MSNFLKIEAGLYPSEDELEQKRQERLEKEEIRHKHVMRRLGEVASESGYVSKRASQEAHDLARWDAEEEWNQMHGATEELETETDHEIAS